MSSAKISAAINDETQLPKVIEGTAFRERVGFNPCVLPPSRAPE
jgi:hypothetical protein